MISKITEHVLRKILSKYKLNDIDEDIYSYGLFMFLSFVLFGIITLAFGIIFGCIIESIIFYMLFQLLRKYCGGYHAGTCGKCEIMTSLIILICIALIKAVVYLNFENFLFFVSAIFAIIIYCLSPVDTMENPLSVEEKTMYRKISRITVLIMISIVSFAYGAKFNLLSIPSCISIVLEGVLLIAGKIKNSKRKIDIG